MYSAGQKVAKRCAACIKLSCRQKVDLVDLVLIDKGNKSIAIIRVRRALLPILRTRNSFVGDDLG